MPSRRSSAGPTRPVPTTFHTSFHRPGFSTHHATPSKPARQMEPGPAPIPAQSRLPSLSSAPFLPASVRLPACNVRKFGSTEPSDWFPRTTR